MEHFFKPGRVYAVAGASVNPDKFGHKVFRWYVDRQLDVVPINFRKETILNVPSVEKITDIKPPNDANGIGLSVVTPPAVSKQLLQDVALLENQVKAIWFQPGTYDPEIIEIAQKLVPHVIQDCVLVNGDHFLSKL